MAKNTKQQETQVTKSHQYIVNKLKEAGFNNIDGGVQLFTDQLRDDYSVSINYMGTGLKIHANEINESELVDNDKIRICKTYECVL